EARAAIDEHCGLELARFENARLVGSRPEYLRDCCPAKCFVGGERLSHFRNAPREPGFATKRNPGPIVLTRLKRVDSAITVPIAVVHPKRLGGIERIGCIEPPISCGEIQQSVAIEIAGRYTGPPTGDRSQSDRFGDFLKRSGLIPE